MGGIERGFVGGFEVGEVVARVFRLVGVGLLTLTCLCCEGL